ncbi:MAG TPA: PstS family phosphate ABC transporter substrate-binding protein [Actinopolymorphaceae bacterium]
MKLERYAGITAAIASGVLVLAGCGGQNPRSTDDSTGAEGGEKSGQVSGEVRVDGSSTVQPLTAAAGELFKEENPGVDVSVATSGTGGGFKKFCAGETDISDASRAIKPEEKAECEKNGVEFAEIQVANDALTVVANPENTWATCLTIDQLKKIWEPAAEGRITSWKQVDPTFPDERLVLYGPGTDSGTFDYFTDEINGEEGASRADYSASEDDNVLVQGVAGTKGALGYFGLSYFEENSDKLKAVQIDGGEGCVEPSVETAQAGEYTPLGRPLFIYVSKKAYAEPHVKAFVDFYVKSEEEITDLAKFVPLNDDQRKKARDAVAGLAG